MFRRCLALTLSQAVHVVPAVAETRTEDRVALVLGMASYTSVTPLKNTTYGALPGEPFYLSGGTTASTEPGLEELAVVWQRVVAANRETLEQSAAAGDSRSLVGLAFA